MENEHIVKAFDEDLSRLRKMIAEMGGLAETQLSDAVKALAKENVKLAEEVMKRDKRINAIEEELDVFAVRTIALRQPMAEDLRVIIAALKVGTNLERIGDYAKNVAKRSITLSNTPHIDSSVVALRHLGQEVQVMINEVLDAYLTLDVDKALAVRDKDEDVDKLHTSLFRELLTYMMEDPRNITFCAHLLFIAKNLERIGDHVTNIADQVHFAVVGTRPEDRRTKKDKASTTIVTPPKTKPAGKGKGPKKS